MTLLRTVLVAGLCALAACTTAIDEEIAAQNIGSFSLDRLVVISNAPIQGALSRDAEDEALKIAVTEAVQAQLGRFDGPSKYSIGIKVQGYVLAQPGIPVLLAPRSTLLLSVNVYDSVPQRLNAKPKNLTIFEDAGADTVVGSGYTQSAAQQLKELAENAAIEIELWLRENPQWFPEPPASEDSEENSLG
ncbi:MAG: hypothetical protein ACPGNV_14755 [Mangrovicoccus sp.]